MSCSGSDDGLSPSLAEAHMMLATSRILTWEQDSSHGVGVMVVWVSVHGLISYGLGVCTSADQLWFGFSAHGLISYGLGVCT